jgi:hypothetical protein
MSAAILQFTLRTLAGLLALTMLAGNAGAAGEAQLKREAIERLAASHDPAIPIGVGRVFVKQAGLLQARALIAERGRRVGLGAAWSPGVAEWQAAEAHLVAIIDRVIASQLEDPAWFRAAWGTAAAGVLSAEEADEIATHFASEGGGQQRAVLELLLVGETLVANYTFTNRIRYDVPGSEREMALLQNAWWVNDHRRVYDFTPYPNAMRFASQDPGVKYSKMLAIQGIDALNRHFDAVVADLRAQLLAQTPRIDEYVAAFEQRRAGAR